MKPSDLPGGPPPGGPLGGRRLDVAANLRIDIDGAPDAVRVTGEGSRLQVDVATAATAARIVRDGRRLGGVRPTLAALTGGLSEADIDVDVSVGGRRVASVGPLARRGAVVRAVGLEGVELAAPLRRALGVAALALAVGLYWAVRRR